jgi:hypothetical protein
LIGPQYSRDPKSNCKGSTPQEIEADDSDYEKDDQDHQKQGKEPNHSLVQFWHLE